MRPDRSSNLKPTLIIFLAVLVVCGVGIVMLLWVKQVQDEKVQKVMERIGTAKTGSVTKTPGDSYDAQLKALHEDINTFDQKSSVEKKLTEPDSTPVAKGIAGSDDRLKKYREAYKALPGQEMENLQGLPPATAAALARLEVEKQAALDKVRGNEAAEARVRLEYLGKMMDIKSGNH